MFLQKNVQTLPNIFSSVSSFTLIKRNTLKIKKF